MWFLTDTEKTQSNLTQETGTKKTFRPIRKVIEGGSVPIPKNWKNFPAMPDNKGDLARFLSEYITEKATHKILIAAGGLKT